VYKHSERIGERIGMPSGRKVNISGWRNRGKTGCCGDTKERVGDLPTDGKAGIFMK
jgi:hypothetical protein